MINGVVLACYTFKCSFEAVLAGLPGSLKFHIHINFDVATFWNFSLNGLIV